MYRLFLIFCSLLLISLGSPSQAQKFKFYVPEYNLKEKKFVTISPKLRRQEDLINFGRIKFTYLDDDVVQTKLVRSDLIENHYLKIKKEKSKVQNNSSSHLLKFPEKVDFSMDYLILETYVLENDQLKLKEQIPVRLDIGVMPKGATCTAVFYCGKFVFPDIEVLDSVHCTSGGALTEIVDVQECDSMILE